jgi:glycosyltransferase involved in cell wall biosynthesis
MVTGDNQSSVSACVSVKAEAHNLPDCLSPLHGLVEDIVVIDTGSTDGSAEIARWLGARVFPFQWIDSFAAARNESLRHATSDWAFWLDADDRLDADNRTKLAALLRSLPADKVGFVIKCLCLPDPVSGRSTTVDHARLFRRHPALRWRYRVHEQILPSLHALGRPVRWSHAVIHHTGYVQPGLRQRKLERDFRLLGASYRCQHFGTC